MRLRESGPKKGSEDEEMKKQSWARIAALGVIVAIMWGGATTAWAEETVGVSLERTINGAVIATYSDGSGDIYLPIGETTAVPKGKQIKVWTTSSGFVQQNGKLERAYLNVNGEDVSDERGTNTYTFTVKEDTTITAGFTPVQREEGSKANEYRMDLGYWTEGILADEGQYYKYQTDSGVLNQRLALYFNGTKVDFTQASVSLFEVYGSGLAGVDKEYRLDQFSVSSDGTLTSKEALTYGTYEFGFTVNYSGVEEDLYLSYTAGIAGECSLPIYEVSYKGRTRYGMNTIVTYNLNTASTVGELVDAYHSKVNKRLAGYEIIGWKNAVNGASLAGETPVASITGEDGYVTICPVFQRKSDGKIYQVVLQ